MKIAYIVPSLRNQGPVIVVQKLINHLILKGCEVDLYYFDDTKECVEIQCSKIKIQMSTPIDFDAYDIIHSHCFRPDRYVKNWKKRIHKAKLISTLHQDTYATFSFQYNAFLSRILTWYWCYIQSHFDGVVCISNQLYDIYKTKITVPMQTIYNGCDCILDNRYDSNILRKLELLRAKYTILGTYAFVTERKGLDQVLKALVDLPSFALVVFGEGPYISSLKEQSFSLKIQDRVFFFDYQSNPCNYLPYFDIYMMPSYSEGFGLSMVEAALNKRPIVCSELPSFHEIFLDNEASFFTLHDISSLKDAILYAYDHRQELGELAYFKSVSAFTSKVMAENYYLYYKSLLML